MEALRTVVEYLSVAYTYWLAPLKLVPKDAWANILIYSAGALWGIELIPQIYKTIKVKDVNGISISFFFMCLMAYTLYGIGNGLLGYWNLVFAHMPSFLLNTIMLTLVFIYKDKK